MADFPALPLFTDALLADTSHLTEQEFGAYLKLLILMWRTSGCKIPADEVWHMRKLGCDSNKYNILYKPLLSEFFKNTGNFIYQKRLLKEFHYLEARYKKQSDAAKSRWNKDSRPQFGNAPTPTPTPISKKESKVSGADSQSSSAEPPRKLNGHARGSRLPTDWKLPAEWGEWAEGLGMRQEDISLEQEKFRDYWIAAAGAKGSKANWQATWRNWIRNHLERSKPHELRR